MQKFDRKCPRGVTALALSALASFAALTAPSQSLAQSDQVNVSYLQGLLPKSDGAITTLGPDLMGDRVNLFNGALEFEHTDVTLPGNSALPVAFTRRHIAGRTVWIRGTMGDWDVETPRITGVFATATGWVNGANEVARCSTYSAPPLQYRPASGGGGGAAAAPAPASGPTVRLPAGGVGAAATSVTFFAADYWQGNFLHVPGAGAQEVFIRPAADTFVPTDGNVYHLVTKGKWHLRCLNALQNAAGEGFIAISPEGMTYRFDWMASRRQPAAKREGASLPRSEYMLMATQVTDRFGKSVNYTYSAADPERLVSIQASDGRQISVSYDASGRVGSVSDGTRAWTYSYDANGSLTSVTRPDNSRWLFDLRPLVHLNTFELGELASCESAGYFPEGNYIGTITHPSGAVGRFTLRFTQYNRSNVTKQCIFVGTKPVGARWPKSTTSQSLVSKHLAGPGLPTAGWTWGYAYGGG
ncbi:MAG: RHS repeat protein, partial [Rubrivivax sp.]|nr:RHS repeat protein [Rubrivivax sp.]